MSTWFSSLYLPNPFKFDEDDHAEPSSPEPTSSPTAGVKHDLSALSHHVRGVAAFLAPPLSPTSQLGSDTSDHPATAGAGKTATTSSETIAGIKNDLVEIGGSFKSLLSSSSNKAVAGISKFASNFLQVQDNLVEDDDYQEAEDVVGINEEVVDFVLEVSMRPELWTDFPLSLPSDFDMSDSQREHTETLEQLVPSLKTLREQICSDLSYGQFWMIYFILLLPRLDDISMKLLSTAEIIHVRETLLQKLQMKKNTLVETSDSEDVQTSAVGITKRGESSYPQKDISSKTANTSGEMQEFETEKSGGNLEDDAAGPCKSSYVQKHSENMEDVSFSDLEDEDSDLSDRLSGFKLAQSARVSSASESNEWVRLNENSGAQVGQTKAGLSTTRGKDSDGEESNDWLTVDDIDLDSLAAV